MLNPRRGVKKYDGEEPQKEILSKMNYLGSSRRGRKDDTMTVIARTALIKTRALFRRLGTVNKMMLRNNFNIGFPKVAQGADEKKLEDALEVLMNLKGL